MHLYYSPQCPSCRKFIDFVNRVPQLKSMRLIDVSTLQPGAVQYVPTVVSDDGKHLVGTAAFDWLKQFQADAEIDSYESIAGGLMYCTVDDPDSATQSVRHFSDFI